MKGKTYKVNGNYIFSGNSEEILGEKTLFKSNSGENLFALYLKDKLGPNIHNTTLAGACCWKGKTHYYYWKEGGTVFASPSITRKDNQVLDYNPIFDWFPFFRTGNDVKTQSLNYLSDFLSHYKKNDTSYWNNIVKFADSNLKLKQSIANIQKDMIVNRQFYQESCVELKNQIFNNLMTDYEKVEPYKFSDDILSCKDSVFVKPSKILRFFKKINLNNKTLASSNKKYYMNKLLHIFLQKISLLNEIGLLKQDGLFIEFNIKRNSLKILKMNLKIDEDLRWSYTVLPKAINTNAAQEISMYELLALDYQRLLKRISKAEALLSKIVPVEFDYYKNMVKIDPPKKRPEITTKEYLKDINKQAIFQAKRKKDAKNYNNYARR